MNLKTKPIFWVKLLHTAIWAVMASGVLYILYSGISGEINSFTYLALMLLGLEIVVLLLFGWMCPLTVVAQRVKPDWKDGDDIFLPTWVAVHNKTIFGSLLVCGLILVGWRLFFAYR